MAAKIMVGKNVFLRRRLERDVMLHKKAQSLFEGVMREPLDQKVFPFGRKKIADLFKHLP